MEGDKRPYNKGDKISRYETLNTHDMMSSPLSNNFQIPRNHSFTFPSYGLPRVYNAHTNSFDSKCVFDQIEMNFPIVKEVFVIIDQGFQVRL